MGRWGRGTFGFEVELAFVPGGAGAGFGHGGSSWGLWVVGSCGCESLRATVRKRGGLSAVGLSKEAWEPTRAHVSGQEASDRVEIVDI